MNPTSAGAGFDANFTEGCATRQSTKKRAFQDLSPDKDGEDDLDLGDYAFVLKSNVGSAKKPVLGSTTSTKKSVAQEKFLSATTAVQAVLTKDDVDHDMR